jgi:hypothetical protein
MTRLRSLTTTFCALHLGFSLGGLATHTTAPSPDASFLEILFSSRTDGDKPVPSVSIICPSIRICQSAHHGKRSKNGTHIQPNNIFCIFSNDLFPFAAILINQPAS